MFEASARHAWRAGAYVAFRAIPIASASKEASPLLCSIEALTTLPAVSSCTRSAAVPETSSARTAGRICGGGGVATMAAAASATEHRALVAGGGVGVDAAGGDGGALDDENACGRATAAMTRGTATCGRRDGVRMGAGVT